ncbi:MAG TPA: hypothetical protein VMT30_07790 [Candidatus Saccharimonadia bacterium]|nr:hypothetical protein [Candidatus Saccharimonadia bacterium]
MKTIVIFCRTIDPDAYPFHDEYLWNSYLDLLLAIKARGAMAYFATDTATYLGDGNFKVAYTAETKKPVREFTKVGDIRAGLVLEKGGFTADDVVVINPPFVNRVAESKSETYRIFGQYQPLTIVCGNRRELERAMDRVQGDLVVVKHPVSSGGESVYIGTRAEVLGEAPDAGYPLLVQEFMDTSVGIEGIAPGIHDLRVKIGGGQILGGMVRVPAPGEYRANRKQGGSIQHLYPDEIPAEAKRMALEIDRYFADYPRFYCVDMANTTRGWKLIELNHKPGLSPASVSPQAAFVNEKIAEYLIEVCPQEGYNRAGSFAN